MANTILLKKNGTASAVPASLSYGELALNYADGKLYYKNADTTIKAIEGAGASLNSPAFIGIPTAPTASFGTNTTQIATTQFVNLSTTAIIDSAFALSIALG